jgi:hypothetical protein
MMLDARAAGGVTLGRRGTGPGGRDRAALETERGRPAGGASS